MSNKIETKRPRRPRRMMMLCGIGAAIAGLLAITITSLAAENVMHARRMNQRTQGDV